MSEEGVWTEYELVKVRSLQSINGNKWKDVCGN